MSEEEPQEKSLFKKVVWHPIIRLPIKYFFHGSLWVMLLSLPLTIVGFIVFEITDYFLGTDMVGQFYESNTNEIVSDFVLGYGWVGGMLTMFLGWFFNSFAEYIEYPEGMERRRPS